MRKKEIKPANVRFHREIGYQIVLLLFVGSGQQIERIDDQAWRVTSGENDNGKAEVLFES
jgi:hypothetical protein